MDGVMLSSRIYSTVSPRVYGGLADPQKHHLHAAWLVIEH
jgi:hypothetical protein